MTIHNLTENDIPPKCRHARSVSQSVGGLGPGWSGPSGVNDKQASYRYKEQNYRGYCSRIHNPEQNSDTT
jgi:hypothetical protein